MQNNHPTITKVTFFKLEHDVNPAVFVSPRPFSSLSLRKSGRVSFNIDGKNVISEADSLTFIPKGCAYVTEVLEEGGMDVMHFYTDFDSEDFAKSPIISKPTYPLTFRNLFENAIQHYLSSGCDLYCMMSAYELLVEAGNEFFCNRQKPHRRMMHCKEYLDKNICDSSLRIGDLADMCGVSQVYFRREFKKFYGDSPLSYIKRKRIDLSCQLLSTGLYSITDVALRTGFDSISYFSYEFKRIVGCSPVEYRGKAL